MWKAAGSTAALRSPVTEKSCQASIYKRKQRPQQPAAVCHNFHNVQKVTNSSSSSRRSAHANENRPCSVCSEYGFKQITSAAWNGFHVVRNGSKRTWNNQNPCLISPPFLSLQPPSDSVLSSVGDFILFRSNCSSLTYWRLWEYRNVQILDGFI